MPFIKEQLTTNNLLLSLLYSVGAVSVVLVILALGFIDVGLVRRKNTLDTWVQKLVSSLIAGGGTLVVGYGIWNWQFNQAFGIPHPLGQALKDWWIGGQFQTHFAGQIGLEVIETVERDGSLSFLVAKPG